MRAYERFLRYIAVPTASDESSGMHPSSEKEWVLARMFQEEMEALGLVDITLSDTCYLYAKLPATAGYEKLPTLGFIAHMDTSPDFADAPMRARLVENYDGGELALGAGRTLSPSMFPHLPTLAGKTLIVTSGDTLLGADDKAGIAEILTLIERLNSEGIPHGPLAVAFTPDEEIGEGADNFDVALFGADFAYTMDGGFEDTLE